MGVVMGEGAYLRERIEYLDERSRDAELRASQLGSSIVELMDDQTESKMRIEMLENKVKELEEDAIVDRRIRHGFGEHGNDPE